MRLEVSVRSLFYLVIHEVSEYLRILKIYRTVLPSDRSLSIIALVSRKPRKRTKKVRTSGFEHYPNGALIRQFLLSLSSPRYLLFTRNKEI